MHWIGVIAAAFVLSAMLLVLLRWLIVVGLPAFNDWYYQTYAIRLPQGIGPVVSLFPVLSTLVMLPVVIIASGAPRKDGDSCKNLVCPGSKSLSRALAGLDQRFE